MQKQNLGLYLTSTAYFDSLLFFMNGACADDTSPTFIDSTKRASVLSETPLFYCDL